MRVFAQAAYAEGTWCKGEQTSQPTIQYSVLSALSGAYVGVLFNAVPDAVRSVSPPRSVSCIPIIQAARRAGALDSVLVYIPECAWCILVVV